MIAVLEIGTALVIIETEIKNETRSIYSTFLYLLFSFLQILFFALILYLYWLSAVILKKIEPVNKRKRWNHFNFQALFKSTNQKSLNCQSSTSFLYKFVCYKKCQWIPRKLGDYKMWSKIMKN